jgi:transposase-like protein
MHLVQRVDFYKRSDVEAVIETLLSKTGRLDPVFDLELGYRYPDVEKAIGKDSHETIKLLEELFEAKLLNSQVYDMEIRCPDCGSPNVSTRYLCPVCGSFHIKKTILMEHLGCGYLGPIVNYGDPMVCPKCQEPMIEGTYRNAGSIYECADCKKQIDTPFVNHWCRTKDFRFSFENAVYQGKFTYYPTQETKEDIDRGIIFISPITAVFDSLGMKRIENPRVIGSSGVELVFDIGYEGTGRKYYLDILQGKEPFGELDILKEYGKINDAKVDTYILVSPGLDASATSISKSYKMNIFDGSNSKEILAKLSESLRTMGLTATSKKETPVHVEVKEEQKEPEAKPKSRWKI